MPAATFIVGGTHHGRRTVTAPLKLVETFHHYRAMLALGYTTITVTNSETGEEIDTGELGPTTDRRQ